MNRAIRKSHILEKKRAMEQELRRWIQQTPGERETLLQLFPDLELDYKMCVKPIMHWPICRSISEWAGVGAIGFVHLNFDLRGTEGCCG